MKKCPFCAEEIKDEARVCMHCKTDLYKKCPSCAEEILAEAKKCKFCGEDLDKSAKAREYVPIPESRSIVTYLIGSLVCGIIYYYLIYKIGKDICTHFKNAKLRPTRDINIIVGLAILGFVFMVIGNVMAVSEARSGYGYSAEVTPPTGFVILYLLFFAASLAYTVYTLYSYSKALVELSLEEGLPCTDKTTTVVILGIFCQVLAPLVLQHQLNKHWQAHAMERR